MSSSYFIINPKRGKGSGLSKAGLLASVKDQKRLDRERDERKKLHEYAKRKKILSSIMTFNFKTRTDFKAGEKGAITRAWKKYGHTAKLVKTGDAVFVKQPAKVRRHFRNSKYDRQIGNKVVTYDSIFHTNKGVIVHEQKRFISKVTFKGRGKNIVQTVHIPKVKTPGGTFIGRHEEFYKRPENETITAFVARIFEELNPQAIALAVNGYIGKEFFTYDQWLKYVEKTIQDMENNNNTDFFTGVFSINFTF